MMTEQEFEHRPTEESYHELQLAYDHFNQALFDNSLPNCLITFQRVKKSYGYHSGKRWANRDGDKTDEIAMNPTYFATRKVKDTLSTLAHEMVHLWQDYFGKPGRGRYHNKEWVAKMKKIGLQPFNITEENRETGDRVNHYIVPGGKFDKIVDEFIETGFTISWLDRMIEPVPNQEEIDENEEDEVLKNIEILESTGTTEEITGMTKSTGGKRTKYTCPNGHYSVWGKKDIDPMCGTCKEYLVVPEEESFSAET